MKLIPGSVAAEWRNDEGTRQYRLLYDSEGLALVQWAHAVETDRVPTWKNSTDDGLATKAARALGVPFSVSVPPPPPYGPLSDVLSKEDARRLPSGAKVLVGGQIRTWVGISHDAKDGWLELTHEECFKEAEGARRAATWWLGFIRPADESAAIACNRIPEPETEGKGETFEFEATVEGFTSERVSLKIDDPRASSWTDWTTVRQGAKRVRIRGEVLP